MPVPRLLDRCPPVRRYRHGAGAGDHRLCLRRGDPRLGGRSSQRRPRPHPRLTLAGRTIAYTGDTAWTSAIGCAAADADLLIAEAYYRDKDIPHHLRLADLNAHKDRLTSRRVIITHMSADVLADDQATPCEQARDGLIVGL